MNINMIMILKNMCTRLTNKTERILRFKKTQKRERERRKFNDRKVKSIKTNFKI